MIDQCKNALGIAPEIKPTEEQKEMISRVLLGCTQGFDADIMVGFTTEIEGKMRWWNYKSLDLLF